MTGLSTMSTNQTETTDYVANMIYENNTLKRILVDGGYIEDGNYYFYVRDHLGNNRIVANREGSVLQSTEYYPFGLSFATSTEADKQPYKYNGKELDTNFDLNWYDYSARHYDGMRFTTVDPLAEKYYSISPYAYVVNNPLRFVDPDGKAIWVAPLIKGLVGAVADATAQVTVQMANDKSFADAVKSIDMTSVGTSFIVSAIGGPGMSTTTKVGMATAVATDALVDVNFDGNIGTSEILGGNKSIMESNLDAATMVLPSVGANSFSKKMTEAISTDLFKNTAKKETQQALKNAKNIVNNTSGQSVLGGMATYTGTMSNGAIRNAAGMNTVGSKQTSIQHLKSHEIATDAISTNLPVLKYDLDEKKHK